MSDNLIFNLIGLLAGVYLMHLWWADTRICISNSEDPPKGLLPGASLAPVSTCLLAIVGAVTIILIVSLLEKIMDVADNQTTLSWWFLLAMLGAAITEEVIFRGYLVVQNKGRSTFIMSILFFSSLFALIHPYLWTHTADNPAGLQWITTLRFKIEPQSLLATASIAVLSLWFYTVRFWPLNPQRSLLPCFSAHAAANLTVFIIKLVSGYVV